jgi:hypothetical protein
MEAAVQGHYLAKGEVRGAAGRNALGHGGQSALARKVGLGHASVRVHVHPRHAVRQLGGMIEHYHVVVQGQMQVRQPLIVGRRAREGQLPCT